MKLIMFLAFVAALACGTKGVSAAAITLAANGKSDYVIAVQRTAAPAEAHAARELQAFLKQISGADLPIVFDASGKKKMIIVGDGAPLRSLKPKVDVSRLGQEGFVIRTYGPHLAIAGGRPRGTLYGVYTFLEEVLGCRWYAPGASFIPKRKSIKLGSLDIKQMPAFEYREPFYFEAEDPDWAARNKVNGNAMNLDEARGGKVAYGRFCHTFDEICPVDKYMQDHPEYFSLIDGKRVGGQERGQLCLTNPDVVKIAIEAVEKWIQENPSATIYSVTQNDNGRWCHCENCEAVDAEEGSPSGLMLRFVNQVADEIGKKHPDKLIDTFAYWYTEAPPKITKPRPNVRVRLCPIYCCEFHDYEKCDKNKEFMERFRGWDRITDTLYIWHYGFAFYHHPMPFPDLDQLVTSIRMYERCGVRGVFMQGKEGNDRVYLRNLKSYLIAKLLWNPKADAKAIIADFISGYYGKAGKPVGELINTLQETVRNKDLHGTCFDDLDARFRFDPDCKETRYLTPQIMARAWELIKQAEAAADTPETKKRVDEVRISFEMVDVLRQVRRAVANPGEKPAALQTWNAYVKKLQNAGYEWWGIRTPLNAKNDEITALLSK